MDDLHRPLSRRSARTLYNVADARLPDGESLPKDFAPSFEAFLRHEGVAAARSNWLLLRWIEWGPVLRLSGAQSFSTRSRGERKRCLARFERAGLAIVRRHYACLCGRIERALAAETQSSDA